MKIRWKYLLLVVTSIILAGNLISAFMRTLEAGPKVIYSFQTQDAAFEFIVDPAVGPDVASMEREFQKFLNLHSQKEDQELYRTFEMKLWQFWNWYYYLTSDLYKYPFKE